MSKFVLTEFTVDSPMCPKCGKETKRHYCDGRSGVGVFDVCHGNPEHLDVRCKDCGFEFYQKVKS